MPADRLIALCHRAWALPILAEMHRAHAAGTGGARLVALSHSLEASCNAIRSSLDHLIALGLAAPRPNHGRPPRPEYALTKRGARLGPACAALDDSLLLFKLRREAMHKWALPTLHAAATLRPARFTELRDQLGGISDRALSRTLRVLTGGGVLRRIVRAEYPPMPVYELTGTGQAIAPYLAPIAAG